MTYKSNFLAYVSSYMYQRVFSRETVVRKYHPFRRVNHMLVTGAGTGGTMMNGYKNEKINSLP